MLQRARLAARTADPAHEAYSRAVPVYWKQRYAGRGQRHRAWVRQEQKREAALRRGGPSLLRRLRTLLKR